jgi:hypothetical protein
VDAAVQDVEKGYGQRGGRDAAEVTIEGQPRGGRTGAGGGQAGPQDGVGAEAGLVGRAVQLQEKTVEGLLIQHVMAAEGGADLCVDVGYRLADALAANALGILIAEFDGFMDAGGGARGHRRPPDAAAGQLDLDLACRVAARIEDF